MKVVNQRRWDITCAIIGFIFIVAATAISTNNPNSQLDPFTILITFGLYLQLRGLKRLARRML